MCVDGVERIKRDLLKRDVVERDVVVAVVEQRGGCTGAGTERFVWFASARNWSGSRSGQGCCVHGVASFRWSRSDALRLVGATKTFSVASSRGKGPGWRAWRLASAASPKVWQR